MGSLCETAYLSMHYNNYTHRLFIVNIRSSPARGNENFDITNLIKFPLSIFNLLVYTT